MSAASPRDVLQTKAVLHGAIAIVAGLILAFIMVWSASQLSLWLLLLLSPIAWFLADALTGLAHIYLDYVSTTPNSGLRELYTYKGDKGSAEYLRQRASVMRHIGPIEQQAFGFKTHHLSPGAIGRRSFMRLVLPILYAVVLPALLLMAAFAALDVLPPAAAWIVALTTTGVGLSQYFHSCSHRKQPPALMANLQRLRLIITPVEHHRHHMTFKQDFCIVSGWANPLVNAIFRWLWKRGWVNEAGLTPSP